MSPKEPEARLTPERWREVEALFLATRGRGPGERATFLEHACGTDLALLAEVESLLAADQGATGFLEPPGAPVREAPVFETTLRAALAGRYSIERELGRGGMATVYLADDVRHHRQVAIKVLHPELGAMLGAERFLREIGIAARLSHPHILPLHDSGTLELGLGRPVLFYAMPYVAGRSLRERLREEVQLPMDEALGIARQVADALDHAHRQGVIHRDIKPENILLAEGQAVLADFGIARALDEVAGDRLTETGLTLGTPAYMSPEQSAGSTRLDGRSDIYALGCVLYEMLGGQPPFLGPTPQAILARHAVDPVPSLRTLRPTVPRAVGQVITRALAKVPADRYPTARAFAEALAEASVSPASSADDAPTTVLEARRAAIRRRRWMFAAAALAGVAVLAAAGVLRSRARPASPTDPNLLAIAPFDVLDPSLQIWHEGLVDILSRDLDGAGPLRTIPQTVGLKRWGGRADRVSAERFGHRTGAGLVVFGSVRKARNIVSLRATVLNVGRQRAEADLEVRGDTADVGDLADSLGIRILQALGRNRQIGSVRRVSIGSRSLPALKAFLSGEQFYRRGLWDSAMVYYGQAVAEDSTFAIAFKQMGMAVDWHPSNEQSYLRGIEYIRKAVVLNRGLSPKDSMQIAADSFDIASGDATDPADLIRYSYRWAATLEEAARRYPEDPEIWYRLGDLQFHSTPPFGADPALALAAFDHAIALDSGFAPAYEHTVTLSTLLNRPDRARRYAAAYLRLDPTDANAAQIRLAALLLDPERAHSAEVARMIDTASVNVLGDAGTNQLGWWPDSGESAVRLLREMTTRSGTGGPFPESDTLMFYQYLALQLAFRGHLHEAYETDRRLLVDAKASRFTWWQDPFLALALVGAVPESVTAKTFGKALEPGTAWPMSYLLTPRQMRGLPWWQARRDTLSLARFVRRAEQETPTQANPTGKLRGRYLRAAAMAYLALARGDSVGALRRFQSIPDTLCIVNVCYYEKLIEARLLASQGQERPAEEVLDLWLWRAEGPLYVLGMVDRARIAETLGERQKAIDSYQFVVDVWLRADPELQPFVVEARNALARLKGE